MKPNAPTTSPPKVALLVETARGYGRGLLSGVAKYSRLRGPWQFHLTPGDFDQELPRMREWRGDGVIARVLDEKMAEAILQTGLPTVFLDFPTSASKLMAKRTPFCVDLSSDSAGAARLAARFLLDKRLSHFAFAGYPFQTWSEKREKAFVEAIRLAGFSTFVYRTPLRSGRPLRWEKEEPILVEWLQSLPKPIGLMACNDQRGREILDACERTDIPVPEKMAVLGVDNDEVLCELCSPPLSSVALHTEKGGYVAAGILDEMMRGNAPAVRHLLVEPIDVIERRSTNVVAIEDDDVSAVLRVIHRGAVATLSVERIVREIAVSRRTLEVKFRKALGRTIHEEIQRVRLDYSKRLLRETESPVDQIATDVGFNTPSYFIQFFKKESGVTPTKYRRDVRNYPT